MSLENNVRNPRTGEFDYALHIMSKGEVADTVQRVREHQPQWRACSLDQRIEVLRQFATAIQANKEPLIEAVSIDTGRHMIAVQEVNGLCGSIERWCLTAPEAEHYGEHISKALPHIAMQQRRVPYPVVGAISPWNFPLLLSFIDAVPALLAGCSVVIKPSEVTPRFAAPLTDVIQSVPQLRDVLAFVSGNGATGAALVKEVDAVAFTGSVATGKKVAAAAAEAFIPAFLELGGKDPAVILHGADLDRAATAILRASVVATGQACQSLERVYVDKRDEAALLKQLVPNASALELNYPDKHSGTIGPLIFGEQARIIEAHLKDAVSKGAIVHCGGEILNHGGGQWIKPTVVSNVNHSMQLMSEETFGPVIPVMAYDSEEQALELANDSVYGLSGAVFAATEEAALAFAEGLNVGGISINDAGLTSMVFEEQKSAFGLSGMGPSRMGASGYLRFLRQQALYLNRGDVFPISALAEQ